MSASDFEPDARTGGAHREHELPEEQLGDASDSALLKEVVQQSLTASSRSEPIDPAELAALCNVARRHAGCSLWAGPIAAELVEVILKARFGTLSSKASFGPEIAGRIANALVEDPPTLKRLEALWSRLGKAIQ